MQEKQQTIFRKTAHVWVQKVLLFGILTVLFWGCAGCGKEETELFLEESLSQTDDEQGSLRENTEQTTGETELSDTEQIAVQETDESAAGSCFVHICGAVKFPGVYELPEGSRIFEAVELAGGLTEEACGEYQNQAQKITDGMKIYIPTTEQIESGEAEQHLWTEEAEGTETSSQTEGKININTADKELLMTLPGIGESRAESIISYRDTSGSFAKIEDIMQVSGIKQGAYEKLKDKISID